MEVVAEARAAVRLGIAAVLGDVETDVEARLCARHDRCTHRHGDQLVRHALPRPRTRATPHDAWVGVVTDDARGTVLRATHAGPQHLYGGDRNVTGRANASLTEASGVADTLPGHGRGWCADNDEATRRNAENEHHQTACRGTNFPCAMCHFFLRSQICTGEPQAGPGRRQRVLLVSAIDCQQTFALSSMRVAALRGILRFAATMLVNIPKTVSHMRYRRRPDASESAGNRTSSTSGSIG